MTSFHCFLMALVVTAAEALQQPSQPAKDTNTAAAVKNDAGYRALTSKMGELQAGLAKARADSLDAVSKQKAELDSKLEEGLQRNRDVEKVNARIAEDIEKVREKNLELRLNANKLTEQCHHITTELEALQTNVSMIQDFMSRSISTTNASWNSPDLQILTELADKDKVTERQRHNEKTLDDLGRLASMIQVAVAEKPAEKPATQSLVNELISSWGSMSSQTDGSVASLKQAFAAEEKKIEHQYTALLQEEGELNSTKQTEKELNVKLRGAVAHLTASRKQLLEERVALQSFAKRLGEQPLHGDATPPPESFSIDPSLEEPAHSPDDRKSVGGGLHRAAVWASSYLGSLR